MTTSLVIGILCGLGVAGIAYALHRLPPPKVHLDFQRRKRLP